MTYGFHAPTKSLMLRVVDPLAVREVIPKSKLIRHPEYNIALQHTLAATKVLRNIGIDAPTPLYTWYDWPGKFTPWDHQKVMSEFHVLNDRGFNLSDPGTMKTNSAIWAADYLMKEGVVRKALVITTLSTIDNVWLTDLRDTLPARTAVILHGSREKRSQQVVRRDADFFILNHDGIKLADLRTALTMRADIDLLIVDEGSAAFRNSQTDSWKELEKFCRKLPRVWWITGTPTPMAPTDAWAQTKIINPAQAPRYFGQFRRQTMNQITQYKWVPRRDAMDTVYKMMQPAIRFEKKDVIDLPPVTSYNRQTTMTAEQRRHFEAMRKVMSMELGAGMRLNAANAADKIGKLRQILCGAIKDPETDTYITLDHQPRLQTLIDVINESKAKVICIVPYKGIINVLDKELRAKKFSTGILNGDVSPVKRAALVREFKTTATPQILLCHDDVVAHGLNFTEADTTVFYAPIYSNDNYVQVIERMNRAGQVNPMRLVRIAAHPLEWDIYGAVDKRKVSQDNLLSMYTQLTKDGMKDAA